MTTEAPYLSTAEQNIVDRFEAALEPEEIRVERVARAIYAADPDVGDAWDETTDYLRDLYRHLARAAIAALESR